MPYAGVQPGGSAPQVIEIDALDLDSPRMLDAGVGPYPSTAYLQYASGSTRQPAGVMVTHRNVLANVDQVFSDYFEHRAKVPPPDIAFVVAALLSRHGNGARRVCAAAGPNRGGWNRRTPGGLDQSGGVSAKAGQVDAAAGDE